jgi:hypothetical protein
MEISLGYPKIRGAGNMILPEHSLVIYSQAKKADIKWSGETIFYANLDAPHPSRSVHPHIAGRSPCLGGFTDAWGRALVKGNLPALMNVARAFLNNSTVDDAYFNINEQYHRWKTHFPDESFAKMMEVTKLIEHNIDKEQDNRRLWNNSLLRLAKEVSERYDDISSLDAFFYIYHHIYTNVFYRDNTKGELNYITLILRRFLYLETVLQDRLDYSWKKHLKIRNSYYLTQQTLFTERPYKFNEERDVSYTNRLLSKWERAIRGLKVPDEELTIESIMQTKKLYATDSTQGKAIYANEAQIEYLMGFYAVYEMRPQLHKIGNFCNTLSSLGYKNNIHELVNKIKEETEFSEAREILTQFAEELEMLLNSILVKDSQGTHIVEDSDKNLNTLYDYFSRKGLASYKAGINELTKGIDEYETELNHTS